MFLSISLEANNRFRDYREVNNAIAGIGDARQIMRQTWLLHPRDLNVDVDAVVNRLTPLLDATCDRLFITEVTGRRLNGWLSRDLWVWANAQNN